MSVNILEKLKKDGYNVPTEDFYTVLDLWQNWYDGYVRSFHRYKVYNGSNEVECMRYTLGMAKTVSEDWANLLMNDKVSITLEGEKEQEFVDTVLEKNNFYNQANEMQELKAALGTSAYVPRVMGVKIGENGEINGDAENIKIDYVFGRNIIPLAWENRTIDECAFATEHFSDNKRYVYLQIHERGANGNYVIKNKLYRCSDEKNSDSSLTEVELSSVGKFKNVPATVNTGSPDKQFFIDRLNIVNNIDPNLPLGVPIYANAIDQLKGCDIAYDSYVNEFVLGKKRVMIKAEATKDFNGNPLFDPNDTVFYLMPEDSQAGSTIQEINSEIRAAQHNEGVQDMLNLLSKKCGFGENHYKFNGGGVTTATEVVSENSEMFRNIKKHEIILEQVIIDLCRCILRLGNNFMNAGLNEDVEISVDFDDSIIEDKGAEFQRDALMLQYGILNPYEFRMKHMNEDEETAKKNLPQLTPSPEDMPQGEE